MKIGIIGSGKFGLVLASIAMENNNEVVLFSRRKQEVDSINANKKSLINQFFIAKPVMKPL